MYYKKECIAMLLAGGQGTRLYDLTEKVAKPAVSFGGKYKIIDFPLSNCANSGIDTVGVLTQYEPMILNEYLCNGAPWDLDRKNGGLYILPPHQGRFGSEWYKGTANAIFQNFEFIDHFKPDYVLILSGDHIYQMDYRDMLKKHKRSKAVCTVATIDVPLIEASRFGICNVNSEGVIYEFEEKPKNPKSNKASMGIYIFNTSTLKEYLAADDLNDESSNDFGKNVIPNLLNNGERVFAYEFSGYWKDVGTVSSLWEANMDLLNDNSRLKLSSYNRRIYSNNIPRPPQYIGSSAIIDNSLISEGCIIEGKVENSVLSPGVTVEEGAEIYSSVLMEGVVVKKGAKVYYSIIDSDCTISENKKVGDVLLGKEKITLVGSGTML